MIVDRITASDTSILVSVSIPSLGVCMAGTPRLSQAQT